MEKPMAENEILADKVCIPCQGGVPRLDIDEANEMIKNFPDWQLNEDGTRITRNFKFENFKQAQIFANKLGDLAEKEFHHPVITFGWGYCNVTFQTNKIRGLHENDIIMAAKVNDLI